MQMETLGSEAVQASWATTLDKAHAGIEIVIERHKQPAVSVVNHEWLQKLKLKAALADCETPEEEMNLLVQHWGAQAKREAAEMGGGSMNEDEYLVWMVELYGQEWVDAALHGEPSHAVGG